MQDLRTLKQRIQAVHNIRKIADAMKMVSTVKYWRLQDALHRARKLCQEMESFIPPAPDGEPDPNPQDSPSVHLVLAFFPHRGMCGPLTQNLAHAAAAWFPADDPAFAGIRFAVFGRKGREAMPSERFPRPEWEMFVLSTENPDDAAVREAARQLAAWVMEGRVLRVEAVMARFENLLRQKPERIQLFPLPPEPEDPGVEVDVEPNPRQFMETFLPMYLESALRRVLLECMVSEHASRMTAMDNASKNAEELIGRFRLEYNKIRQSKITLELMEIISGSEALQ